MLWLPAGLPRRTAACNKLSVGEIQPTVCRQNYEHHSLEVDTGQSPLPHLIDVHKPSRGQEAFPRTKSYWSSPAGSLVERELSPTIVGSAPLCLSRYCCHDDPNSRVGWQDEEAGVRGCPAGSHSGNSASREGKRPIYLRCWTASALLYAWAPSPTSVEVQRIFALPTGRPVRVGRAKGSRALQTRGPLHRFIIRTPLWSMGRWGIFISNFSPGNVLFRKVIQV